MIEFALTDNTNDLMQIIELQEANHVSAIKSEDWATEGFVTLQYSLDDLQVMKGNYKHVIARSGNRVIGYCLVLLKERGERFPLLASMMKTIEEASFKKEAINKKRYFVMGQICVDKSFREQGVFRKLYDKLRSQMMEDFDLAITEVSTKNVRSVNAHREIGFRKVQEAEGQGSEEWDVIAWDWS